jgi:hypothetical protein
MAKLWIREFKGLARNGSAQVVLEPGTDQTPVTFSTSAQSAAFIAGTTMVGMIADAAFHYVVADNPTATTNALKVPANTLIHIGVAAGQKVAAIAAV